MEPNSSRWHEVTPSSFAHDRAALAHVREVDPLVAAPAGCYLGEIKNYRGRTTNCGSTWTLTGERRRTVDNPLPLAEQVAEELNGPLGRAGARDRDAGSMPPGVCVPRRARHGL